MREIFSKKTFWAILVILLLAVFLYPPHQNSYGYGDFWGWIFNPGSGKVDLGMILVESIIAILVAIGICLIPFHKGNKKKLS
jgi:hypothetical protein